MEFLKEKNKLQVHGYLNDVYFYRSIHLLEINNKHRCINSSLSKSVSLGNRIKFLPKESINTKPSCFSRHLKDIIESDC